MTSLEKTIRSAENGTIVTNFKKIASHKKKEIIMRGVLSVTVISGEDLPAMDMTGKSDPYVVLTMKKTKTKYKTRVVNESLNPMWDQTFDFVVEDGLHDMLILEVWDHDTFGKDYMGRLHHDSDKSYNGGTVRGKFSLRRHKIRKVELTS
uniref:C2 domain-containing protein n=1 Tax=Ananas comosus var. bracteatus TaxID=296719 RepID=A0A6V7P4P1_ANACO|nr:unnamed protein product [Ananas comosus var. bracteatus]